MSNGPTDRDRMIRAQADLEDRLSDAAPVQGGVMPVLLDRWDWARRPDCPKTVPMRLLTEERARKNHGGQSLQRLAGRGGMSPCELLACIEDRKYERLCLNDAVDGLIRAIGA